MREFPDSDIPIETLAEMLARGEVMVYPTETVAGIGCIGSNENAVSRVFQIKRRDRSKPVSYAFSSLEMIRKYAQIPQFVTPLFQYFPGPLTLILPKKVSAPALHGVAPDSLGVRIPNVSWLLALIKKLGEPVITTSANISGQPSATTVTELGEEILNQIDILIRWKGRLHQSSSTVILVNDEISVVREGAIPSSHIYELLGR